MKLFLSGINVASLTLLSRVTGLIRELLIASLFGASNVADCFNVAFKLPNLFRRIFAEGALSSVFIPIYNKKLSESENAARIFTSEIFTLLCIILIILVPAVQIFMPSLMFIIAPGFQSDHSKFTTTVLLCRITMPYLLFISIAALMGCLLSSKGKFTAFAVSPVILNIISIISVILLNNSSQSEILLSISLLVAGLLQVVFMFYHVTRNSLSFPIIFKLNNSDKDIKTFLSGMLPAAASSGTQQLGIFISQSIASFIPGAISILSYADRIYQFPLSIIGATFSTILLPELSRIYKSKNYEQANILQNNSIKIAMLLSLPAAFGIILLARPITHIIYERGAFTAADTESTALIIAIFATGLPAFILSKILIPIFYANHDTQTPFRITMNSLVVNTILNISLMSSFGYIGIAVGSSLAAWYNLWLLYRNTRRLFNISIGRDVLIFSGNVLLSCTVMVGVLLGISINLGKYYYAHSLTVKSISLLATVMISIFIFVISCLVLGLHKNLKIRI